MQEEYQKVYNLQKETILYKLQLIFYTIGNFMGAPKEYKGSVATIN